jgi:hypothetical protein
MKLVLAVSLALVGSPGLFAPASPHHLVMSDDGRVAEFYGVPITLKLSDVRSLGFPYKEGSEASGEGQELRTAIISARNGVRVVVVFDHNGDSIDIKTTSRRAVDPRGVRVGDSLGRVQTLWPEGKFFGGNSIEGGYRYARFATGTNVVLDLSTRNVRTDPSRTLVTAIHLFGFKT